MFGDITDSMTDEGLRGLPGYILRGRGTVGDVRRIDGRVTLRQHFMAFSKPQYPLGSVDAAGRVLAESVGSPMQIVDEGSLEVIKNWRAAHHFPLQIVKMMLKGRAKRIDPQALVSQRMKRLPSIQNKLIRGQSETMRLSQMQDIGGCRAVLKHISDVDRLMALFREGSAENPTGRHKMVGTRDYIADPKADGYRGVHYVFRYQSPSPDRSAWNGLRIEIQVRSKLQHAWATAVETVDTFTGQSLKFALGTNIGDPTWRRFFALKGRQPGLASRASVRRGCYCFENGISELLLGYAGIRAALNSAIAKTR